MLYYLAQEFGDQIPLLNVFRYITFRTGGALMTSMIIVFLFGPMIIRTLRVRQKKGQPIRADGPVTHFKKAGTPTMGGLMILFGLTGSILLWADLSSVYVWTVLLVTLLFGAIGFYDDYLKVTKSSANGFSGRMRLLLEFIVAAGASLVIMLWGDQTASVSGVDMSSALTFPFFKNFVLQLGWFFVVFGAFVIVAAGNAVNFTDGLDGLAIVPVMIAAASFGAIVYLSGNKVFADYLQIHFVLGTGELAIICGAVIGAGMGFLWFNAPPAAIFMGDTGSLALGGLLGTVAVAAKHDYRRVVCDRSFVGDYSSWLVQIDREKGV